ncbi:ABC transporter substrate-binding protein [Paenibacillus sp. NPDC056579]|uniref:ABC transporter substrate-binding protein n=1 Tax=Paenibacillus sp. NPDC056579 TaxID=3345871 RepID=UPI00369D7D8C
MKRSHLLLAVPLVTLIFFSACSQGGTTATGDSGKNEAEAVVKSNAPIKLLFYTAQNSNYAQEENFQREIGKYITEKFPNITVEHIHKAKGADYPELIVAGTVPDIVLESSTNVNSRIMANGLHYDIGELIKKHNFDLNRIDPVLLQVIRNWGDGKLYGLPFMGSNLILFYNKDIFDKFGVAYPKDGITWDEIYDIAQKISRTDNGANYVGLRYNSPLVFKYNQRSLGFMDAKTDKAAVNTEAWQQLFANFKRIYDIPANAPSIAGSFGGGTSAMNMDVTEKLITMYQSNPNLNWDVVAAPVFKDAPKVGFQPNFYSMYITEQSKNKDAAFEVIAHLLSDEVQTKLSKQALVTPLVNKNIQSVFGQDIEWLKGRNTQAVFYNKYAPPAPIREKGTTFVDVSGIPGNTFDAMLKNGTDINSALRQAEESIEKSIADVKAQEAAKK